MLHRKRENATPPSTILTGTRTNEARWRDRVRWTNDLPPVLAAAAIALDEWDDLELLQYSPCSASTRARPAAQPGKA